MCYCKGNDTASARSDRTFHQKQTTVRNNSIRMLKRATLLFCLPLCDYIEEVRVRMLHCSFTRARDRIAVISRAGKVQITTTIEQGSYQVLCASFVVASDPAEGSIADAARSIVRSTRCRIIAIRRVYCGDSASPSVSGRWRLIDMTAEGKIP
jgi:hypothetical protein